MHKTWICTNTTTTRKASSKGCHSLLPGNVQPKKYTCHGMSGTRFMSVLVWRPARPTKGIESPVHGGLEVNKNKPSCMSILLAWGTPHQRDGHTFVTFALRYVATVSILLSCARATQHQKDGHTFVTIALGCLKAKVTHLCPFLWCGHTPMSIRCVYYHAVAL